MITDGFYSVINRIYFSFAGKNRDTGAGAVPLWVGSGSKVTISFFFILSWRFYGLKDVIACEA